MKKIQLILVGVFVLLAFILVPACKKDVGETPAPPAVDPCSTISAKYSADIEPILQTECVNPGCHAAGGGSSGYDLSTYALVKAYADQGRIRARVLEGNTNGWMPQGGPLPEASRQKIDCWLKSGAPNN